ncbi:unnamed protein product [Macrosiphum euphorbiae]|uniref:Uncharacterized protein n=1 Tax=Macrosiphum euphorbiae TaxID=13131 RepID=A0AAV0WS47_9HEMI|nr:unnamed protein product [Macrosiphum euphorbiae]
MITNDKIKKKELLESDEDLRDTEGLIYEKVEDFKYLGATLSTKNDWAIQIGIRISKAEKIEGQNVSTIDAANEINQLQNNLDQKQNSYYLPHATRNIMVKLQETGDINEENAKTATSNFYKTSKEYLEVVSVQRRSKKI